jgi:toxin ParE1/3/4
MINLRPKAEVDLLEIWDFIFQSAGMERADKFIDQIKANFEILETFPEMGKPRENLAPTLRSIPEGNYLIFYQPTSQGIDVVRVFHGARDLEALLENDPDTFR